MAQVLPCSNADVSFFTPPGGSSLDAQLSIEPDSPTLHALQTATHHLLTLKRPIAFPTETVYGLAAPALHPSTVSQIFTTKGRPSDNPLIVHVSSRSMLRNLLPNDYVPSSTYETLMNAFWPGPLTLLFPADPTLIPSIVTANHPTVAVRMPSHPIARALIALSDTPIAAPSANSSGKPSPTKAEHVLRDLGEKLGVILDGGSCDVGLESTVVDGLHPDGNLRVLRPGGVTVEALEEVLSKQGSSAKVLVHRRDYADEEMERAPTTPGMKYRHYSPSVPVVLLMASPPSSPISRPTESLQAILESLPSSLDRSSADVRSISVGLLLSSDSPLSQCLLQMTTQMNLTFKLFNMGSISTPMVVAQRLFDGLLTLERQGVDLILIEGVEEVKEGLAVMNRVRKAAGEVRYVTLG